MAAATLIRAADAPLLPLDKVCGYEKWKPVSFEGHADVSAMSCRGSKNRRTQKIINGECAVAMQVSAKPGGATVKAWVKVADAGDPRANRMFWPPENYKAADLKFHDSKGEAVLPTRKLRITGTLRKTDDCQLSVDQIDLAK